MSQMSLTGGFIDCRGSYFGSGVELSTAFAAARARHSAFRIWHSAFVVLKVRINFFTELMKCFLPLGFKFTIWRRLV
jgi:hypothetical protein